jgi:hypothetical protein
MLRRLIKPVATVHPYEKGRAPHRAGSDAAIEELGVQTIEELF